MRIQSRAGNFNMTISEVTTENGELVMIGKMGVWQAKTYVSVDDLRAMLSELKVSAGVLDFLALFGFRYVRRLVEREEETAVPLVLVSGESGTERELTGPVERR
jgi:hypothetical protein